MASCGVQPHEVKDISDDKKGEDRRVSDRVTLNTIELAKGTVLNVRVLEAIGLQRETHFGLKRVRIRNPFCSLQLRDITEKTTTSKMRKTKTTKSTLFPMWDESFTFHVHQNDFNNKEAVLRFNIQGYERMHSTHLGMVDIPLMEIGKNCLLSEDGSFQSWLQLQKRIPPRTAVAGKLFVAFQINRKSNKKEVNVPTIHGIETKEEEIGVYIGSMNCGNAAPPDSLREWLHPNIKKHQIVVVGCQECQWKKEKNEEEIWRDKILEAINEVEFGENKYRTLITHSLEEMRIFCFVDTTSLINKKVCNVSAWHEATGIGNLYGNKGGTVISFDYGGTSLCFINSHLAAHQADEHWQRRNSDYKEICSISTGVGNGKQELIEKFHHVFWMGDLNYRCNYKQMEGAKNTPSKELFDEYTKIIAEGKFDEMLKDDQLNISRDKGEAFFRFQEAKITFSPTFKVFVDKDFEYQPKRSPSWCDRILWKNAEGFEGGVKCNQYTNAPNIKSSDHKPVFGEFSILTWPRAPGRLGNGKISKNNNGTISFRSCKATNLRQADMGNASDPYLHFPRQELLAVHHKSRKVTGSNDPRWRDEDLPRLQLLRTNPTFLSKSLLLVQCRDYDRFSAADKIGSTCLSLKRLVEDPGKWIPFKQTLTYQGVESGVLEGEFLLDL